jgi:hypothetical protein
MEHFPKFPAESGIGFVYLGKGYGDRYKIGQTDNLEQRLRQHRTTEPAFRYYQTHETHEFKACEQYLLAHFEGRRIQATSETFDISEEDFRQALPSAVLYADALHRGREKWNELRAAESTSVEIDATEEFIEMYSRLKDLCGKIEAFESEADLIKLRLALAIDKNAGIAGLISFKTQHKIDLADRRGLAEILKVERPDLYERFWKLTPSRRFRIK